jgi:hypothetical protein
MKKFCIHIGIGLAVFFLSYFSPKLLIAALDWLDKSKIVGASWLGLATWELAIGTVVIFVLWIISLFGLPCPWHSRFRGAAAWYLYGILGLPGGLAGVAVPGFISTWLYQNGIWPVGMIFRLVEIAVAIGVLGGLAYWIFGMVYGMFIPQEQDGHVSEGFAEHQEEHSALTTKGWVIWFIFCVSLVGLLSAGVGYLALEYPPEAAPKTERDQAQLEDCAMAVVGCVHCSASDDPSDLASVESGKKELKDMIQGYDRASLDEICSLVDESLRFERSLQKDLVAYMEESSRTSEASKFKMSGRTRQILDKLPNKLRAFLEENVVTAEQLGSNNFNPPKNWRELLDKGTARIWTIYGQTYSELLGRPMPPPED